MNTTIRVGDVVTSRWGWFHVEKVVRFPVETARLECILTGRRRSLPTSELQVLPCHAGRGG